MSTSKNSVNRGPVLNSPSAASGRQIGPVLATLLVANNMIGSGIFLLPVALAGVGSVTTLGWVLAAMGALALALVLAKLSVMHPLAGGHCAFAHAGFGARLGFTAYWMYWVCCIIGNLAIALGAIGYLASFFPALGQGTPTLIASLILIAIMTALNIVGPRLVCQFDSFALIAGLVPILLVATAGWFYFDPQMFSASWNINSAPLLEVVPRSLVLVFWAFLGLESAAVATAVVTNPKRNVPIATVGGVLLAAVVYLAASAAIFGLVPSATLAKSTAPFADAAVILLGPTAGGLVALAAVSKATGTLAGWLLVTAQTGRAAAERGLFPRLFGRVNRGGVPVQNLLIVAALMFVMALLTQSPTLASQFSRLIEVSVQLSLASFTIACLALFRLDGELPVGTQRAYRAIASVACLFCVLVIAASPPDQVTITAGILAVSVLLFPLMRRR